MPDCTPRRTKVKVAFAPELMVPKFPVIVPFWKIPEPWLMPMKPVNSSSAGSAVTVWTLAAGSGPAFAGVRTTMVVWVEPQ